MLDYQKTIPFFDPITLKDMESVALQDRVDTKGCGNF